jgi:hypothetical protein
MRKGRTTMNDNELIGSRNARREAPMRKVTPIPRRMRHLPCDERGFVVPWFACHDDTGRPHISLRDDEKWWEAVRRDRCWLCGQPLAVFKAFVATPSNVVMRVVFEPPSHLDCAEYAMRVCPYLSNPAIRRMQHAERHVDQDWLVRHAGQRPAPNPGVFAVWVTRSYTLARLRDEPAITIGDPESVRWWTRGRPATDAEVEAGLAVARRYFPTKPSHDTWEVLSTKAS